MSWNLRISPFYMTFAIHLFHNITFNQRRKKNSPPFFQSWHFVSSIVRRHKNKTCMELRKKKNNNSEQQFVTYVVRYSLEKCIYARIFEAVRSDLLEY